MTKLCFIADLHYYSKSLGTSGRAYELRSGSDQKCLAESGDIIDSAFDMISKSDDDAAVILGDLTNNGERISHEEIREKLYKLKEKKPVYLLTATHDWCCDENPRRFEGSSVFSDVPTMKSEELKDFYCDFGLKGARSEFITHLGTFSYTVDINEKVRLLVLNDDQNGKGQPGYTDEHFQWIEKEIRDAKNEGKLLIGAQHHLVMNHIHPMMSFGSVCVGNKEEVASRLADAGLKFLFVGHSHIQHISTFTSKNNNTLTEINVGSLVGYPCPVIEVEIDGEKMKIKTVHPKEFSFEGKTYDTLEYTKKHSMKLLDHIIEGAEKDRGEFSDRLSALGVPKEKASLLYIIAHPICKYIKNLTVESGYKKLKLFGLGRLFDKKNLEPFFKKSVMSFAYEIFASAMDGSKVRYKKGDAYYEAVMSFMNIPIKIKDCKETRAMRECVESILLGGKYNINNCEIEL